MLYMWVPKQVVPIEKKRLSKSYWDLRFMRLIYRALGDLLHQFTRKSFLEFASNFGLGSILLKHLRQFALDQTLLKLINISVIDSYLSYQF